MAEKTHNFEGITDTAALTSGSGGNTNTLGNDFFNSIAGNNVPIALAAAAFQGSEGMACRTSTNSASCAIWGTSLALTEFYSRWYFRFTANPGTSTGGKMFNIAGPTGTPPQGSVNFFRTAGGVNQFTLNNNAGAIIATAATAPVAGTWYRFETFTHVDAATGYITLRIYTDTAATAANFTEELNAAGATATWAIATSTGEVDFGLISANTSFPGASEYFYIDNAATGRTTTWWGPAPITGSFSNTVVPTLTGALAVGGTLTCSNGTWIPTPSSFNHYWHRADDAAGTNLVEIGATGSTYTLSSSDVSKYIRAGVIPVA